MREIRLNLRTKILIGFGSLLIFYTISALFIYFTVNRSKDFIINESARQERGLALLNDFKDMVLRANMYTFYWVTQAKNDVSGKQELINIHVQEFPLLKEAIETEILPTADSTERAQINAQINRFEQLKEKQNDIMLFLDIEEVYLDPLVMFDVELMLEKYIIPISSDLITITDELLVRKNKEKMMVEGEILDSFKQMEKVIIASFILMVLLSLGFAVFTAQRISEPVNQVRNVIDQLSMGEQPDTIKRITSDEIGDMSKAVNRLIAGSKSTAVFADQIGQKKFDTSYEPLSRRDILGNALLNMRNNLLEVAEQEQHRNWANEGFREFGEILRQPFDTLDELTYHLLVELVKSLKANQGFFFVIEENDNEDVHLRLSATYAWSKRRFLEKKVYPNEGLLGQAWVEKDHIFMTDIPEDYVEISSGLGNASPNVLFILPLIFADKVYGAIEIASFTVFEQYQIDFMLRLGESIASTLASETTNERTKQLLADSQDKAEQLRMQEEEMRQNMEELSATQEELSRKVKDYEKRIRELEGQQQV